MSDINTAVADGLKVLDPGRPIREADIPNVGSNPPHFVAVINFEQIEPEKMRIFPYAVAA